MTSPSFSTSPRCKGGCVFLIVVVSELPLQNSYQMTIGKAHLILESEPNHFFRLSGFGNWLQNWIMTIVQNFYLLWLVHVDYRTVVSVSWLVQTDLKNLLLKKSEKKINCHDLIPGMFVTKMLGQRREFILKISQWNFSKIFLASTDWTCLHIKVTINWKKRFFMRFEKPEDSDKSNDDVTITLFPMSHNLWRHLLSIQTSYQMDAVEYIYLQSLFINW